MCKLVSKKGLISSENGLIYKEDELSRLTETACGMSELSAAFGAGFHDFPTGCVAPKQRDDNPNYDSRIIVLLAPFRRRLDEPIAVKSAAF